MQIFLVIWNVILTIALVVILIIGAAWNTTLTADLISLQEWSSELGDSNNNLKEWFEEDFEGAVKYYVDERMQEYAEIIVKEVIRGLAQP